MVQEGVEEHPELAVVLPAVAGVGGKQNDAAVPARDVDDGGAAVDLVGAAQVAAEHAAAERHEDPVVAKPPRDFEERSVRVTDRHPARVVSVEDRMVRSGDLRFDQRPRRVEARPGAAGVDIPGEAVLGRDVARLAKGHEQTAVLDEPAELEDPLEPHAPGDVLRRAVVAEKPVAVGLGVGPRAAPRRDVEDQPLGGPALVRNQDDVVVRSQVAGPDPLLEDEVERDLEPVERVADPSHLLGVAPGAVDRQAGDVDRMGRDLRPRVEPRRGQAELGHRGPEACGVRAPGRRGHDERSGGKRLPVDLEALLGRVHRRRPQPVAQRRQMVRAVVRDRVAEPRLGRAPDGSGHARAGNGLDRRLEDLGVVDGDDVDPEHQAHRPAGVVVGPETVVGERLVPEQDLRQPEVRLAALDDVRAGRVGVVAEGEGVAGAADLDTLDAQQVDERRHPRHVALPGRDDEAVRRVRLALRHRVPRLAVEVLEDDGRVRCGELQRAEGGGLAVVGVVPHRPLDLLVGRRGPVPFAARARLLGGVVLGLQVTLHRRGAAVAEGLVEPDQPVVVRRHEREIARRPHVDEAVRPHPGHAVARQLRHLEVREPRQLAVDDGVEQGVLRGLPAEGVEERHRLVEVVHHRRMPLQVPVEHVPHAPLRVVDVAVVVVEDVLPPVRRAPDAVAVVGDVDQVPVVPVDVAVAPVGLGGGNQGDDEVVADPVEEGAFLDREPVGQLHQHLGRTRLAAVQAGHQEIDGLGSRDDRLCLRLAQPAGIREVGEVAAVAVEVREGRLVRNRHHHHLAVLVGAADRGDRDPRRGVGEGSVVVQQLGVVGQLARRPDVAPEDVPG